MTFAAIILLILGVLFFAAMDDDEMAVRRWASFAFGCAAFTLSFFAIWKVVFA